MNNMNRRTFLNASIIGSLGALTANGFVSGQQTPPPKIQGFDQTVTDVDKTQVWEPVSDRKIRVGIAGFGTCQFGAQFGLPGTYAPLADFELLRKAAASCEAHGYHYKAGNVLSSDVFYSDSSNVDKWMKMGVMAVEMEASALYMNAARAGKRALAICTISDHVILGENTTPEEREKTFTNMMKVALSLV